MPIKSSSEFFKRALPYLRGELKPEWDIYTSWAKAVAGSRFKVSRFEDVQRFLMFVAHPRTGHTLIGQLLNSHPNILVSHELDHLEYVRRGLRDQDTLFQLINNRDKWFQNQGRQWAGYDYEVPGGEQGRSEQLLVIGDKSGGLSSSQLYRDSSLLAELREILNVDLRIIHVERHPLDAIASEHRVYLPTVLDSTAKFFKQCQAIENVYQEVNGDQITRIYFEDFVKNTEKRLRELCEFLGVSAPEGWIDSCRELVYNSPNKSRDSVTWRSGEKQAVAALSADYSFLGIYDFPHI